mmetsp:Transcript_23565/g.42187  ORF Transcript_23565/g.42187 Transcript_23565/m.42187 type:complete len:594 (-) Transcript_23565:209-1990(-)
MSPENQSREIAENLQQQPILEEDALTLLDAFDFDPDSSYIIDDDRLADPISNNANVTPFMLGDYSEKGHFLPSSSVVRNEVLEGVPLCEIDDDMDTRTSDEPIEGIAFRCIYCKHAKERVEMAVIRPQNLMAIRDSFIHFQQTHMHKCTFIPSDIRRCHLDFKSQEEFHPAMIGMIADDQEFLWVSSAIRRGLRDAEQGGILYCPELAANQESELKSEEEPRLNDVVVGRGGLVNKFPGNIYWRQLMKEVKSDYVESQIGKNGKKSVITRLIVEAVRNQSPPGRFLVQDKLTGIWKEIGDEKAMKKTSQAIRDMGTVKHAVKDGDATAFIATDATITVKQESKERMKRVKHDVVKAATVPIGTTMGVAQENSETWEVMNLFKEEIGEWINTEPSYLPPTKKRKLESKDTASACVLEKNAEVDWKILEEVLSDSMFHDHSVMKNKSPTSSSGHNGVSKAKGGKKNKALTSSSGCNGASKAKGGKKKKSPTSRSGYNGVSRAKGGHYEARFSAYRVGSYVLKTDAALAYDAFLRASGQKKHFIKIHFKVEQDYIDAREHELKVRGGITVDLVKTLDYITSKVNDAVSKTRVGGVK